MTAMTEGARLVEEAVTERAEARDVAVTRMSWNGDEGLKSKQSMQTLFVTSTQRGGRASFTRDQLAEAGRSGELPSGAAVVIDRLIADLHVPAETGLPPRGGSG